MNHSNRWQTVDLRMVWPQNTLHQYDSWYMRVDICIARTEKTSETKRKRNLFLESDRGTLVWLVSEKRRTHVRIKLRNAVYLNSRHLNLCHQNIQYDSWTLSSQYATVLLLICGRQLLWRSHEDCANLQVNDGTWNVIWQHKDGHKYLKWNCPGICATKVLKRALD